MLGFNTLVLKKVKKYNFVNTVIVFPQTCRTIFPFPKPNYAMLYQFISLVFLRLAVSLIPNPLVPYCAKYSISLQIFMTVIANVATINSATLS